jgi:hypothetical protein
MMCAQNKCGFLLFIVLAVALSGCCPADALRAHLREIAHDVEGISAAQARCREDPTQNSDVCDQVATSLDNIRTAATEAAAQ